MAKITREILRARPPRSHTYSYAALVVFLILTLGVTLVFYRNSKGRDATRFNTDVERIQATARGQVDVYLALLNGARGYVESVDNLDKRSFASYVRSLDINKNFAGVRRVGFVRTMRSSEIDRATQSVTVAGEKLTIQPFIEKQTYSPLVFSEPDDVDVTAPLGFDLESDADRWAVMQQARDSGSAVASGRLAPIASRSAEQAPWIVVIFMPVYKRNVLVDTIDDRRSNLVGFLYASFQPENFLKEIEESTPGSDVSVKIFDGRSEKMALLAGSPPSSESAPSNSDAFWSESPLDIAGRQWLVRYDTLPSFDEQSSVQWTPIIFFAGIGVSFLLFGMTYREVSARADLQKTAIELIAAQGEVRRLFEEEKHSRLAAERASRAKDEFLAVVSHELRTPLNAIAGWARILQVNDISDETKTTALAKIQKNLRRQTSIVDELLTYSDAMSRTPDFSGIVSVRDAFETAVEAALRSAAEKQIEIERIDKLSDQTIKGDVDLLATAVEGIITNAIKFSAPGATIQAEAVERDGEVLMIVTDHGTGIESDFLPHVFERYSQADQAFTRSYGGLGLGLPIACQIVKLHRGSVRAESEGRDKGAVFTITLPLEDVKNAP